MLPLRHALSGLGDLGQLLDQGGVAVKGDAYTVCNTGLGGQFEARAGAGYRLIASLAGEPPALLAINGESQSGHPGSRHYADQLAPWLAGEYHVLVMDRTPPGRQGENLLALEPAG